MSTGVGVIIVGGLRYLQALQFDLVRAALRECEVMVRIVPHITRRLRFLMSIGRASLCPKWTVCSGRWLCGFTVVHWLEDRANGPSESGNTSVCPRTVSSF